MRILSADAMREVDRKAIEDIGIPSLVLMENAARGVVDVLLDLEGDAPIGSVAIFSGPGNNGGDGLAIARHLDIRGIEAVVFLVSFGKELKGDPAVQRSVCEAQGISVFDVEAEEGLEHALAFARETDWIVDALFGTGLSRALEDFVADVVEGLNELPVPILAVDLPSGLNGTRTDVFGPRVEADVTVTLGALKPATVLPPAADAVGELRVADLGVPPHLFEEVHEAEGRLELLTEVEMAGLLGVRDPSSHKGSFGHGVVVAGSPGKAGAAILTLRGAVRAGIGLVTAVVPESLVPVVDGGSLESMTLAFTDVEDVLEFLDDKMACAVGPGLGRDETTRETIRRLVLEAPIPVVLDADGINAFAGRAEELRQRTAPTILTPHPGEMGRLLGLSSSDVQADRIAVVRKAVRATGAVVVLKGHLSLIGAPADADGDAVDVSVCPTGNPGMATGGSGDVLTGVILGLLGQVDRPVDAARLGVYLHGVAGDLAVEETGERSLAAGDLVDWMGRAMERVSGAGVE